MQKNRLFVGNLSYDWTTDELEEALNEVFAAYGEIKSIHLPKHPGSDRHKGIAFITLESEEAATAAKDELEGKPFGPDGDDAPNARPLHVDFARPRENRDDNSRRY
jgi:RNA recognition motif-containing protein